MSRFGAVSTWLSIPISVALILGTFAIPQSASVHAAVAAASHKTLTAAFAENFSTLDPAIGYDPFSWTGEHAIFNALLGYRNAPGLKGTQLVPDIAAKLPKISKDGHFYTFHLRHHVHFAAPVKRLVTARDFKYSIERALSKGTAGPMFESPFWSPLKGTAAFWSGKAKHIGGIKVLNRFTIQFHLTSPDLAFENVIAMPFASAVPKEWVRREGKSFARHPVGTGPYRLKLWQQGAQMILVKNKHYFHKGLPHVPRVHIDFGVPSHLQILRAEKGQLDLPGDFVSTTDYLSLRFSPTYAKQLVTASDIAIRYLSMNMKMAPFKGNLALRRAFNMAINKKHILRLLNQRGVVMNGILPPTMPGAKKHFTYYKYNPKKAKKLLKKAGYKRGQLHLSLLFDDSNADYRTVTDAVQSDLAKIGVDITPRPVSDSTYYNLIYTAGKSALSLGVWGEDYPDPSDFFDPILSCNASSNAAFFCSHAVDRLGNKARGDTNRKQRYKLYRKMERMVMAKAPWVPIYDDKEVDFRGANVKGFFIHPVWPFSYDRYRLK